MSKLTYITSARCGWCRKADPIIEELQKSGLEITVLDVTVEEDKKLASEIKNKHNQNCGTPFFIDAETGNSQCGFSEENIRKWAAGEKIPPPKKKKPSPPQKHLPVGKVPPGVTEDKMGLLGRKRKRRTLDEKAKIVIQDNRPHWWSKIAELRCLREVQKGFITRLWDFIPFHSQAPHMKQHGDQYIVAVTSAENIEDQQFLGYARCIDNDIGICVFPEFQGRGIASMLLEELLKRHPDAIARVKVDNESSKKLFERFGFTVRDTIDVDCLHGVIFEKVMVMKRGQNKT